MFSLLRCRWSLVMGLVGLLCLACSTSSWSMSWDPDVNGPEHGGESARSWSTAVKDGVHWLVDPDGRYFFSKGVNIVHPWPDKRLVKGDPARAMDTPAFYWGKWFASVNDWRRHAERELTGWGFNTRGAWSDDSRVFSMPIIIELDLGRLAQVHWFDPFEPESEERVYRIALRATAPYRDDPRVIGYFTDNEVGWWSSPIFEWYMKYPWKKRTKRVLWQHLHDYYQGDWNRLLVDFVPDRWTKNWEDLKDVGVVLKLRPGGRGITVINEVTCIIARRYYQLMYGALRRAHPGALIVGDRLPLYYNQSAVLAMRDAVDVISTNYNVDVPDGWVAPYYFEGLNRLSGGKPVVVSEFFFAANENSSGNKNNGHLMSVATQEERARGAANAVRNFARFPNIVGIHWFQYYDEPPGGRYDGEDFNFGLVDVHNRPYGLLTETLRQANGEIEEIHAASRFEQPDSPVPSIPPGASRERAAPATIPRALLPISLEDKSLVDWDKRETRLLGFHTPAPFVPFGDVHMAWSPEGLYLSCLAGNYLDRRLLEYTGEFPITETFQLHLRIDAPGGPRHYAVCLTPVDTARFSNPYDKRWEVRPGLYRCERGRPAARIPDEGRVQHMDKPLPHIGFEAFLPAESLGLDQLDAGLKLKLNVWVTNYFREMTMTWAESTEEYREVELGTAAKHHQEG